MKLEETPGTAFIYLQIFLNIARQVIEYRQTFATESSGIKEVLSNRSLQTMLLAKLNTSVKADR